MLQEEWPLLIIVPASLRLVWAEELEKWLPHLRPSSIHVIEGKSDRLQGADLPAVCITSYEMMQRLTCDACKGIDGRPVVLTACSGSQVWVGGHSTRSSFRSRNLCFHPKTSFLHWKSKLRNTWGCVSASGRCSSSYQP